MVPVFLCRRTEAGIRFLDPASVRRYAGGLPDGLLECVIRPRKSQRSNQANRYYFGVVVKSLSDFTGYELDEMHELLAMKFLRLEDDPVTGSPRRQRTPKTTTADFSAYVDRCIRFAAEQGVVIPDPARVDCA